MRRFIATLPLVLVTLWLTALPALAAEEKASDDEINGILLSLIVGVVVGVGLFLHAYSSNEPAHEGDHDGHDGHH